MGCSSIQRCSGSQGSVKDMCFFYPSFGKLCVHEAQSLGAQVHVHAGIGLGL